jgi:eukaryotic-like serine/threonine-protein kinase
MSLIKFLGSRVFLLQIIAAGAVILLLVTATMIGLRSYTLHGQKFPVPDLIGMTEKEVLEKTRDMHLRYRIIDSVYLHSQDPGTVIDQVPEPGFQVKKGRTLLLTINARAPEQVILPRLRDISFRQALVLMENRGLLPGNITHKPSEYNDLVLRVFHDSTEIFGGEILAKGSRIDLEIGKVSGNHKTAVPDLIGLTREDARLILADVLLNMGVILYDASVTTSEDSLNARIWRQRPNPRLSPDTELGTSVDIWVTTDEEKIMQAIEN